MSRTTRIGPKGGNRLCHCCDKCTPVWHPLSPGEDLSSCPSHCCPCPPTGNVCVQFAEPPPPDNHGLCPNLLASCFTMEAAVAPGSVPPYTHSEGYEEWGCGMNEGFGPQDTEAGNLCYQNRDYDTGCMPNYPVHPEEFMLSLATWEFEKWSYSGVICQTDSCAGEHLTISLCCCDSINPTRQAVDFTDDCHACRYQFTWNWLNQPGTMEKCTCPPLGMFDMNFVPPEGGVSDGPGIMTWNMQDGNCGEGKPEAFGGNEGWAITFNLTDVLWNCDCCAGGGDMDTSTPITVLAIVTPEPPGGCC